MVDIAPSSRHQFVHCGRTVYEWDQTLEEVNIYVDVPPGTSAKALFCDITTSRVSLGIKGNPPYLAHDLPGVCKQDESFWTLEDSTLHVSLTKAAVGEPWPAAFAGHVSDAGAQESDQQRLMLERFQKEHPGFDFSGATFNGNVPNPHTFMREQ
ncbi:hypothetical protein FOA52_001180 [Chlamydomonas sp. UWO 241]|nr:hypothetical protein FOA52_001180 [Chlamydomonas sp. UWO 241]